MILSFFLNFLTLECVRPIDCPGTSLRNYHSRLRKIQKELRSHLHRWVASSHASSRDINVSADGT